MKKNFFTLVSLLSIMTMGLVSCGQSESETTEETEEMNEMLEVQASRHALPEGVLSGEFSVSASKKVRFAQGNLQYLPATKAWRLAEHQYDYIGNSNEDIATDYDGWIDLFGWGTSGWDNGGNCFDPCSTDIVPKFYGKGYYGPRGADAKYEADLTGDYAQSDWGVFNAIANGGNQPNLWRTLSQKEWEYLLLKRPMSIQLVALGSVGGTNGLFIFPDDYDTDNIYTLGKLDYEFKSFNDGKGISHKYRDYSGFNDYTRDEWAQLESTGVVFLPAAGSRSGKLISSVNEAGHYWTSTHGNGDMLHYAYNYSKSLLITGSTVAVCTKSSRSDGYSVRLVQDVVE